MRAGPTLCTRVSFHCDEHETRPSWGEGAAPTGHAAHSTQGERRLPQAVGPGGWAFPQVWIFMWSPGALAAQLKKRIQFYLLTPWR